MMAFLRDTFDPVPLDKQILDQVIDAEFEDLEDAIQYFSAVRAKSDCIVSRDANALPKPERPVLTPAEFLSVHTF